MDTNTNKTLKSSRQQVNGYPNQGFYSDHSNAPKINGETTSTRHHEEEGTKTVIFMRHDKIEFSYHSWKIFTPIHMFLSFVRDTLVIKKNLQDTKIYVSFRGIVNRIREALYLNITSESDYKDFGYQKFMTFLLHEVDPPLSKKDNRIRMKSIPKEIDVIYCSSAKRSIEMAMLIKETLEKRGYKSPRIAYDLKEELAEVKFSKDVLTLKEFKRYGGLVGCRTAILRKWYYGKNQAETFQDSIKRAEKLCQFLKNNRETNMILVTHGWYLRLLKMYFMGEKKNLANLRSRDKILKYGRSFRIHLSNSFQPHPSFTQPTSAEADSSSTLETEKDGTKTLEPAHQI